MVPGAATWGEGVVSARRAILAAVRAARPASAALPDVEAAVARFACDWASERESRTRVERFRQMAVEAGARVTEGSRRDIERGVCEAYPRAERVLSIVPGVRQTLATSPVHELDLLVCEAAFGVAETGAVWLTESRVGGMAALFLAKHVAVVLERSAIVDSMHEAYECASVRAEPYGVFVGGPSKTADIEQALVEGAHGPVSMTIVLVGEVGHDMT
jgi:L-lactate dehydrogenase complex protein LldG